MNYKLIIPILLVLTSSLIAGPSKISPDLSVLGAGNVNVIIRFNVIPGAHENNKVKSVGGSLTRVLRSARAGLYSVPRAGLLRLAADSEVQYLSPDRGMRAKLEYAEPTTNANLAFAQGIIGNGITVAVIDSGITAHDDLGGSAASRILFAQSFVSGDTTTDDAYGHGTHVAGIIAGNATDSSGSQYTNTFRGIAPGANLVNLRVLDENGQGSDSEVIAAIDEAVALQSIYNIRVINLSLGRAVY